MKPSQMEHIIIYRNEAEFCSWPFNAGMWRAGSDEIVVGFMNIACDYSYPAQLSHRRVETFGNISAVRSTDGGRTWGERDVVADNNKLNEELQYAPPAKYETPGDFTNPDTLLACWSTPNSGEPDIKAWIKRSEDGGRSWGPAVLLPDCGIPRYQGRPSYVVREDGTILLFLTAQPETDPHDRPVVFSSKDGGCDWALHSYMPGSSLYRVICPSPALLPDGTILTAVRCKPSMTSAFNELYASDDGGLTWRFMNRINEQGDTCDLIRLQDGRLFIVYGYRRPPFGIRAKISEDNGQTWGPELVLRDDGGSLDLGYPRCLQLADGTIVASYYFNDADTSRPTGGTRYIGGTLLRV